MLMNSENSKPLWNTSQGFTFGTKWICEDMINVRHYQTSVSARHGRI